MHHVEEITRMLPVHRSDELPPVDVVERNHRDFELDLKDLLRLGRQPRDLDRPDGATHHVVHLDLDFYSVSFHQKLCLTRIG